MINIGILGSSYSRGRHGESLYANYDRTLNKGDVPFEDWFEEFKTNPDYNFINVALPGHGTEHYLNKIVSLKRNKDIKAVVLECVGNRSMYNFFDESIDKNFQFEKGHSVYKTGKTKFGRIVNEEMLNTENIDELIDMTFNNNKGLCSYYRGIHDTQPGYKLSEKDYKQYKWSALRMAEIDRSQDFFGFIDLYQSISLCNMLGIKCIVWAHSWPFEEEKGFTEMLQGATYVKFPDASTAKEYYIKKYNYDSNMVLCDSAHFNSDIDKIMVRDFIMPCIDKTI